MSGTEAKKKDGRQLLSGPVRTQGKTPNPQRVVHVEDRAWRLVWVLNAGFEPLRTLDCVMSDA